MDQLINSKTAQKLNINGLVLWQIDEQNKTGFSRLLAKGFKWQEEDAPLAVYRNWDQTNGQTMGLHKATESPNQGFKLNMIGSASDSECETEEESSFFIENARTGLVLTLDASTGVVSSAEKVAGAENQLWKWSASCQISGDFLVSSETGTFLAARVTETSELREGNVWVFDAEMATLKSGNGYARVLKRKPLGMEGSVKLLKKGPNKGKPWKWYQWNLVKN